MDRSQRVGGRPCARFRNGISETPMGHHELASTSMSLRARTCGLPLPAWTVVGCTMACQPIVATPARALARTERLPLMAITQRFLNSTVCSTPIGVVHFLAVSNSRPAASASQSSCSLRSGYDSAGLRRRQHS